MTIEVGLLLSVLSFGMSCLVNRFNQKKALEKDNKEQGYSQGKLDEKLANIEKMLSKIETKLDFYDAEIDKRIEKAIDVHIQAYHK